MRLGGADVMLTAIQKAACLMHARKPIFLRRLAEARACIEYALTLAAKPYCSHGFGKDSACVTALVLERQPDIPIRLLTRDQTRELHPDLDSVINRWRARWPLLNLLEINADRLGAYGSNEGNMRRVLRESGDFDGAFIGLRKGESGNRAFSLHYHREHEQFAIHRYGIHDDYGRAGSLRICPIANWSTDDVAAFIVSNEIPVLSLYYEKGFEARTSPALNSTAVALGETAELRRRNPAEWNELLRREPWRSRDT